MTDLHSHILPCLDDGSKSSEETIKLMNLEINDGVETLALTPHFLPERYPIEEFLIRRKKSFDLVQNMLSSSDRDLHIIAGAEVLLSPKITEINELKELCYTNTDYMLVEFPMDYYREWIPEILYEIKLKGIAPIIAHVERYPYFNRHMEVLADLVDSGTMMQVNAGSVLSDRPHVQKKVSYLIKHNLVHIIATDAHSVAHRPPRLKEAMQLIAKKYGVAFANYFYENSRAVAENRMPDLREPIKERKNFFDFMVNTIRLGG